MFLGMLLSVTLAVQGASLRLGAEREIAPATTALRTHAEMTAIGAGADGFLSVWRSEELYRSMATPLDRDGVPMTPLGTALPDYLWYPAVGWNGSDYVIAGFSMKQNGGIVAMRLRPDGAPVDLTPRLIAPEISATDLRIAFNGEELLLTWVTQSMTTQTLWGTVLGRELETLQPKFEIDARDVSGVAQPFDHDASPSVATSGDAFLVAWENVRAPQSFTFVRVDGEGEVTRGATMQSESPMQQPTLVADATGFIALWHDHAAIRGVRVAGDGTPLAQPVTMIERDAIFDFAAAAGPQETAIVWRELTDVTCPYYSTPNHALSVRRFDQSLRAGSASQTLGDATAQNDRVVVAATDQAIVASWLARQCDGLNAVQAAEISHEQAVRTISAARSPSSQSDPSTSSDGTNVLAVWSEDNVEGGPQSVHAALLDREGRILDSSIDMSSGTPGGVAPRVAWGGGRYLVVFRRGEQVLARFVRHDGAADGEEIPIAVASTTPQVVWSGSDFVLIWSDGATLQSRRLSPSREISIGGRLQTDGVVTLASVTAADHEVAALFRVETSSSVSIRAATLESEWSSVQTLASALRPCASLACDDFFPVAIGWSGRRSVAVWAKTAGPGRDSWLESAALDGGEKMSIAFLSAYPNQTSGTLAWYGSNFLLAWRGRGVTSAAMMVYLTRLGEAGASLDGPASGTRAYTLPRDAGAPPGIAVVSPGRAVVVYNRMSGQIEALTQRVFARAVSAGTSRRRAVATGTAPLQFTAGSASRSRE